VVALLHDSYKHPNKAFGKIFTPLFKVTGWVPRQAFEAALEGAAEAAAVEEAEAEVEVEPPPRSKAKPNAYAVAKGKQLPPGAKGKPPASHSPGRAYRGEDEDTPF
jgi:hypothetical protein